jgi:hypothetical protein
MSIKIFKDTIGNRTCELPVCSAVPSRNALPRSPKNHMAQANTPCGKFAYFVNVKAGGICSYRCALNCAYRGLFLCLVLHGNVMIGENISIYLTKLILFPST